MTQIDPARLEALGPAERIISALTQFTDHLYHGRPGFVVKDARYNIGVRWTHATWRVQEDGSKVVFQKDKVGNKTVETRKGVLDADGKTVRENGLVVGEYRKPGLFPEVAAWMYGQIAEVFKLDNELAARWASWAFDQERKDVKVVLAAFLLVQNRKGDPVRNNGKIEFRDDDFRAVGEAMVLTRKKGSELNPRQVLLIDEVLDLPQVREINLKLGFNQSSKNPQKRRYKKAVHKWLVYREDNPKLLAGLVKGGMKGIVRSLATTSAYKPQNPESFYKTLRWKQTQAKDGRRKLGFDVQLDAAETWTGLTEAQICEKIVSEKPSWKVIVGRLPADGVTRAVVAAAVEAKVFSNKDLIILTPTLEDLGLLDVEPVKSAWKKAAQEAEDQRALNIAKNVKKEETKKALEAAADAATAKAIEKVTRNLRTYFFVDKSGSMQGAIETCTRILSKFLGGFPLDRVHVAVFNTIGSELTFKSGSSAAVEHAFKGHTAGGGTYHASGVAALARHKPKEGEDALFIFIGDEEEDGGGLALSTAVSQLGFKPSAFARLYVKGTQSHGRGSAVRGAAARLGIPCLEIQESLFDDPYSVTHTLTNLIASTPVTAAPTVAPVARRTTLIEQILNTPLLQKPTWA